MSHLVASEYKCFEDIRRTRPDGSEYLTVMCGIVCVPIAGVVAALAALDTDELAGTGER